MARVSDFFFQKNPSLNIFFCFIYFDWGGGKGGLANVSEFDLQRIQIFFFFFVFFFLFFFFGGGGGGGLIEGSE